MAGAATGRKPDDMRAARFQLVTTAPLEIGLRASGRQHEPLAASRRSGSPPPSALRTALTPVTAPSVITSRFAWVR
jgi:hypothetical protein